MTTDAAPYTLNLRALQRWREQRLRVESRADGGARGVFRFDGSTCGNIPWAMDYVVEVGAAAHGHVIEAMSCTVVPGDTGHMKMCSYIETGGRILEIADSEKPLLGQPLAAVFTWKPALSPAGCLCAAASRNHKWSAVLQTLHLALHDPADARAGNLS